MFKFLFVCSRKKNCVLTQHCHIYKPTVLNHPAPPLTFSCVFLLQGFGCFILIMITSFLGTVGACFSPNHGLHLSYIQWQHLWTYSAKLCSTVGCIFTTNSWCADITTIFSFCLPDVESLFIHCKISKYLRQTLGGVYVVFKAEMQSEWRIIISMNFQINSPVE